MAEGTPRATPCGWMAREDLVSGFGRSRKGAGCGLELLRRLGSVLATSSRFRLLIQYLSKLPLQGLLYGGPGNLSDGSSLVTGHWGPKFATGDNVGMKVP